MIEEDKQMKLPSNWEARQRKAEWLLNDEKVRQDAKEKVHIEFIECNVIFKFIFGMFLLFVIILGARL